MKKYKSYTTDEVLVLMFVLSLMISVAFFVPTKTTGDVSGTGEPALNVSVREKIDIEFTVLDFFPQITIYDLQNITVEVTNTGSTEYDAMLTTYVYNLSNGSILTLLSTYTDSTVHLYPGNTRGQKYIFAPAQEGSHFIRASVHYGSRVKEAWGSFFVGEQPPGPPSPPGNQTNQTNQTPPPPQQPPSPGGGGGGGGTGGGGNGTGQQGGGNGTSGSGGGGGVSNGTVVPIPPPPQQPAVGGQILSTPSIKLDYPERVVVYRNISTLTAIKITNDGGTAISDLRMQLSTPLVINTDVNPKGSQRLVVGQAMTFLIALSTNADLGEYVLEFEVLSSQVKKEGTIIIEVRDSPESLRDLIYMRMLNYEFLVGEIATEIESVGIRGYDVSIPGKFILSAKQGLDRTRTFYDDKEYVKAFGELLDVEQDIKDAVFTLGNVVGKFYAREGNALYLTVFAVPVILFFVILYRRRKERRPKLLREAKEE